MGCWVFNQGVQNWKDFCLKINIPKGNCWILRFGVMGRFQKVPKFDFQSQLSIFKLFYFLKWCSIFDTSPLHQFSKFNNFLWTCWFLGKNLSNFAPPAWKLNNPYYRIGCHWGQWNWHYYWEEWGQRDWWEFHPVCQSRRLKSRNLGTSCLCCFYIWMRNRPCRPKSTKKKR